MTRQVSNERERAQIMLDGLNDGSVVLDVHGHAWQYGGIYWYRSYGDDSMVSSHDLAFKAPFKVIHRAPKQERVLLLGDKR